MNPYQEFYQASIVKETGKALIQVQRSLKVLERTGLIETKRRGRMVYYHADHSHPAFEDLKKAFLKTVGIGDQLRTLLRKHRQHIDLVWIFGSVARGEERADSDIDLIFVSNRSLLELSKIVGPISRKIKRELNAVFVTPDELRQKIISNDYFISDIILRPKIWLIGDDHELERLIERTQPQVAAAEQK
ncbi:MAG TPA: nucleotidyltransferase domain-containing protein [Chlamydiales bacterium]|nr:nucleotidyltransferase domain-containing protein [Chlamydiales bacterium]